MAVVICIAIVILLVSAVFWGMMKGLTEQPIPDNQGNLELNENGVYELRIL